METSLSFPDTICIIVEFVLFRRSLCFHIPFIGYLF